MIYPPSLRKLFIFAIASFLSLLLLLPEGLAAPVKYSQLSIKEVSVERVEQERREEQSPEPGVVEEVAAVAPANSEQLLLQIQSSVVMSDEQEQMLRNGIPLTFVYDIRLNDHRGFFSKQIDSKELRFLLFYHGLSKQFVVRDLAQEKQDSYPTLSLALLHISTPSNIEISFERRENADYQGRVRLWVDIEALPTPLRIPAYLSSKWQLNSGWHAWGLSL